MVVLLLWVCAGTYYVILFVLSVEQVHCGIEVDYHEGLPFFVLSHTGFPYYKELGRMDNKKKDLLCVLLLGCEARSRKQNKKRDLF
jgi:hypothetical protein